MLVYNKVNGQNVYDDSYYCEYDSLAMFLCVFSFVSGSLVVDHGYQPCDVPLMAWKYWEDVVISNDICVVFLELLIDSAVLHVQTCLWEIIEELPCLFMVVRQSNISSCRLDHLSIICGWM